MNLRTGLRSARMKAVLIVSLVVLLAVLTWLIPARDVVVHNVLHHLNILPFMLAGLFFGWRGAAKTVLFAALLFTPSVYRHWHHAPLDAQDQIVELSTFGAAGIIAGLLAEREKTQRKRVEATKVELEQMSIELRQYIERLKKTERLTAAGQLSASLAHEIRNPLASISGAAGILARGQASPDSRADCLEILTMESQRLNKLLTNFLEFARPRLPRLQPTDVEDIVQSVTSLAQHAAVQHGVILQVQTQRNLREINCDAEQIKQLLLNLILNAIQASHEQGRVVIRTSLEYGQLCIDVMDEGPGIAAEEMEHIFEPFFTTKDDGTGLGLSIASNIALQHEGSLTCRANVPSGTIFRVQLPNAEVPMPQRATVVA